MSKNIIKKIFFSFFSLGFSGLGWYFFYLAFRNGAVGISNWLYWVDWVLALALSYGFLLLLSIAEDKALFAAISLLNACWLLLFLGFGNTVLILAALIFISGLSLMNFAIWASRGLSLEYFSSAYHKFSFLSLVLIILVSLLVQPVLNKSISSGNYQKIAEYAWPYISGSIPQFNSDKTVDQYLAEQLAAQGVNHPTTPMFQQGRGQLSDQLGFPVTGSEKMSAIGKTLLAQKISDLFGQYNLDKYGAVLIFSFLLIFWPILKFIFAFFSELIYLLMRALKLVKVSEKQMLSKVLEL